MGELKHKKDEHIWLGKRQDWQADMGGFGAYEVLRRRFCINGRKALAAFVEPGMVLVWIDIRGARCNPIEEILILSLVLMQTSL